MVAITQRSTANSAVAAANSTMQTWCASNGVTFVNPGWTSGDLLDGIHPKDDAYDKLVSALAAAGLIVEDRAAAVSNGVYTFGGYDSGYGYSYEILQNDPGTSFVIEADVTPEIGAYNTDWNQTGLGFVFEQNGHSVLFMYEDTIHIFPVIDGKRNGKAHPYAMGTFGSNANVYKDAGTTVRLKLTCDEGNIYMHASKDGGNTWYALYTEGEHYALATLNANLAAQGMGFSFDPSQAGFRVGIGSYVGTSDRIKVGGAVVENVQCYPVYTVSGTVAGNVSGTVTATAANGKTYTAALTAGSYAINLPNGTYKLYFDCGATEGLIPSVTVNSADVTAPALEKTYQKLLGTHKEGADGTANWVLTDNGKYAVQTSNTKSDSITMGYFASGVNMSTTDFVIETKVHRASGNMVMVGLAINGKNAAGNAETTVFGLGNDNYFAQVRALKANGWPGYKTVAAYDRTSFTLKIVKSGTTITYYINGTEACSWTTSDYDFAGWTDVKVGLGFYRMYDVTFSDYSYTVGSRQVISGTVGGNVNGTVVATDLNDPSVTYTDTLANGKYAIALPNGTYKLYFDCGTTEGLIPNVTVNGADVTQNLDKTYQKLLGTHKEGTAGTANWVLTDNGKYAVQTSDESVDAITMGYFAEGVDLTTTNFVLETQVTIANPNGNTVMLGLGINGTNPNASGNSTMVIGLNNSNNSAQIRVMGAGASWPNSWRDGLTYEHTSFRLRIEKSSDEIRYTIDGTLVATWYANDYNFKWTNAKIGLGFYRMYDVTFSNYSYTVTN